MIVVSCSNDRHYPRHMRVPLVTIAALLGAAALGCDTGDAPTIQPGATVLPDARTATVRIVYAGSTARRPDLPPSAQACVNGVGATHIHPSWRNFAGIALQPAPPDRYEISFSDVPVDTRVSFRINDQNSCDENPTGAVTRNVLVNDVRLIQNATTPGNGEEPGFAFVVARNGTITQ